MRRHPASVTVRPQPLPLLLLHPLPLPMGGRPPHPALSRQPPRRPATILATSLIMRASMKGRCIAVNLGPTSPITHTPPTQLLNPYPPPPVPPPAAAVPHRPPTPKVSAQSTSLSLSSHFYTTPRHTPPHSSPPRTIPATTVSSLLTRVRQTTCSRTRVHSFCTGLSPVVVSAWATTPLPPSWARDWQSSQSMDGKS